jgi:hypothetical protein
MTLPQLDLDFLNERGGEHSVTLEAGMVCVVLSEFTLPPGYVNPAASLLLRLNPGFPDVPPDMWWFDPPVRRTDGVIVPATEHQETHLGKTWQRWSRHLNQGQWRSGIDRLENFVGLIRSELSRCAVQG